MTATTKEASSPEARFDLQIGHRPTADSTPEPAVEQRGLNGNTSECAVVVPINDVPTDYAPLGSTEDELATAMAARALPMLRWSPGLQWMHYDGQQWRYDEMLEHFAIARQVARDAGALLPDQRRRLATAKTVSAIAQLARTDPRLRIASSAWDADPLLVNTPGGVVDLRTGRMRRRSELDYMTMCTAAPMGYVDQCPRWMRFLEEVFVLQDGTPDLDLIAHMQRAVGYWLSGSVREQVMWFLYGLGANGKSVFLALIRWLSGSYAIRQPASVLMSRQQGQEAHSTEIADLRGVRLSVSSELEQNQHLAESKIKELTGETTQRARRMRQDSFEFALTHKHVLAGNFRPRLHGGDPAMRRRVLLVPFLATFAGDQMDRDLLPKLQAEGPGILAWAVEGARQWYASGLAVPASVIDNSVEYFDDFDDISQWMAECCRRIDQEKATPLYRSYADWKKARGESVPSMASWAERLASVSGIGKTKSNGVMVYRGISLTSEERTRQEPPSGWQRYGDHRG